MNKFVSDDQLDSFKREKPSTEYEHGWNDALAFAYMHSKEMEIPECTEVSMPGVKVVNIDYVENFFAD